MCITQWHSLPRGLTRSGVMDRGRHRGEDGSSLMAAKSLSTSEHWVGGISKSGMLAPTLALHSTDGGETWANDPSCSKVLGQMITASAPSQQLDPLTHR